MIRRCKQKIKRVLGREFTHLERMTVEVNSIDEIHKLYNFAQQPVLNDPELDNFDYPEDLNQRRRRDAEVLASVFANSNSSGKQALEIGTSEGKTTALLASNAPDLTIHTINIPPEEVASGAGGNYTTWALEKEKIGRYYRDAGHTNVRQIFANTATWKPDIGPICAAFIDGCHDAEFVVNDTKKVLSIAEPGSFIMWHDYDLTQARAYEWIYDVCLGVEQLFHDGLLQGRIYHLRDSWIGLYRVPG